MSNYTLKAITHDFQSLAASGDSNNALLDNSVDFGNIPVRVVKMKTQFMWNSNVSEERDLLMSIYRETEGATALQLDDEDTVKNATQGSQFYRRPYRVHTMTTTFGAAGHMDHFLKPVILRNVLLDDDDDIVVGFTNGASAFGATAQHMLCRTEAWWKRI